MNVHVQSVQFKCYVESYAISISLYSLLVQGSQKIRIMSTIMVQHSSIVLIDKPQQEYMTWLDLEDPSVQNQGSQTHMMDPKGTQRLEEG